MNTSPESTFCYSATWQIWCRWCLIALQFFFFNRVIFHSKIERESHKPASLPTQIDSQTEQKVCFSCQLHLWTAVVSEPVYLPPLHLALSCALPRFLEVSATETAPSLLSFLFFFFHSVSLTSSIKSLCCICFLFGSHNPAITILVRKHAVISHCRGKRLHFCLSEYPQLPADPRFDRLEVHSADVLQCPWAWHWIEVCWATTFP